MLLGSALSALLIRWHPSEDASVGLHASPLRHHQVANESSTVRAVQKAERRSAHGESVPVDSQEVQLNGKSRCKPSLSENDVLLQ